MVNILHGHVVGKIECGNERSTKVLYIIFASKVAVLQVP